MSHAVWFVHSSDKESLSFRRYTCIFGCIIQFSSKYMSLPSRERERGTTAL